MIKVMAWNEPRKAVGIDFDSGAVFILLPQNAEVSPEDMRMAENVLAENKGYLDRVHHGTNETAKEGESDGTG